MHSDPELFRQAQAAFNTLKITKGQITTIATCDEQGNPDVAPIGSMRVVDEKTVHVLQGFLPRTMKNLERNPRAAFSVTLPATLGTLISMFGKGADAPSGYRMYCEFCGMEESRESIMAEAREISSRVPWVMRKGFRRFIDQNIKRLLTFSIREIRVT